MIAARDGVGQGHAFDGVEMVDRRLMCALFALRRRTAGRRRWCAPDRRDRRRRASAACALPVAGCRRRRAAASTCRPAPAARASPRIAPVESSAITRIGEPAEPFEEVVGMPRPAPQPDVADPALVGGIVAEALDLRVGEGLADDRRPAGSARRDNPAGRSAARGKRAATRSPIPAGSILAPGSAER